MKVYFRPFQLLVVTLTAAVVGAALVTTLALAQGGGPVKTPHDPWAGLSPSQREAIVAAAHARNDEFLRNFVAQHRDAHSLPVGSLDTYGAPPTNLAAAVTAADLVVHGKVQLVDFETNPSGGMPIATAEVRVLDTLKGHAVRLIAVGQLGGPVARENGGVLVQFRMSPLILPGDEVVLLLNQVGAAEPFRVVLGGVYFVRNGSVVGEPAEHYGINGEPVQQFLNRLLAAG
jgi:hypothetical protein